MKHLCMLAVLVTSSLVVLAQGATNFHDYYGRDIHGDNTDFSDYYGKKVMVVNTASFCGFTPQFEDLQTLYEQYAQHNFEIIGFPCNDFDNQDPGADSTILEFCTEEYGVTFKMMSKVFVVEPDTAPVYRWLQEGALNGVADAPVTWNFHKFLIDEAGDWVAHHNSFTSPTSTEITDWIMSPSALSVSQQAQTTNQLIQAVSTIGSETIRLNYLGTKPEQLNVQLYTLDGQLAANMFAGTSTPGQTIEVNVNAQPAGIYLIRATTSSTQQTLRYALVR